MANLKLRMKIGVHEFDAEGPVEEVNGRFEIWREMIAPKGQTAAVGSGALAFTGLTPTVTITGPVMVPPDDAKSVMLQRVFSVDEKRDLVTLRIHPMGDTAVADAILALVYGYWSLRGNDDVRVTKLTRSVQLSGLGSGRIDRMAAAHLGTSLSKTGTSKGSKYMLTAPGRAKAEVVIKEMFDRVA